MRHQASTPPFRGSDGEVVPASIAEGDREIEWRVCQGMAPGGSCGGCSVRESGLLEGGVSTLEVSA